MTLPLSTSSSPSYFWVNYKLSSATTLVPGNTYHLDIMKRRLHPLMRLFPIRKGFAYGFQNSTYFQDGHAEFEPFGLWFGWTQWGVTNRTDGDLQFYFSVVP